MRSFLTVTILLISTYFLGGQTNEHTHEQNTFRIRNAPFCNKHEHPDHSQRELIAKQFRKWQSETHAKSMAPIRTIPVVFHLLEYDPAITNAQVETAVASLNNAFSHSHNNPAGDDYSGGTRGVDTQIEFCLAQRAPDGGVTNGIVRWRTDYENMDVDLEDAKLKTQGQWDPRYYLNVWVVAHLNTETGQSYTGSTWWERETGLGGYSGGPGGVVGPDAKTDGVIVTGLGSALLAHEIGHYMSLAHTFTGGCKNDDCLVDGDGICDTPPDNSQAGCNQNTCDSDTLSNYSNGIFTTDVPDMTSNFMDYSSCPSEFTQGQADKMLFVIDNQRINLAVEPPSNNDACLKPCNADFSVEFAISERYPQPNVAIDFTSAILGTGIDSYEWYVEALGHPGFNYPVAWLKGYTPSTTPIGTGPNLQHTFLDPGKYRVYLKAWNSADPTCFASYARNVRVTCLGIDARFTPNVRLIASKQDRGKMLDSVLFRNRSVNATDFEWTVRHEPYDGMTPAQPDYISTDTSLHHTFLEPGDYYITLIAKNGPNCTDTCGPFLLPVLDPTIDGRLKINRVDCYKEDSLRIAFEMFNDGFDTIRMGMPVTFYDEDPRNAAPTPKILGTYFLDKIVYGKDNSEKFVAILPSTRPELDQVWGVFNDFGASTFPITWPTPDGNVMSVNSEFPASGENELKYDNNFAKKAKFKFEAFLDLPDSWACTDTEIQLEASHRNGRNLAGIDWTPTTHLSCTNCLDPFFSLQNTAVDQEVIITSEYICRDTVSTNVPALTQDIPVASVTNPPDLCPGAAPLDLNNFVSGTLLTWYPSENDNNGSSTPPVMDTSTPGTYSTWVSDNVNGCEGPKVELRYTINTSIPPPGIISSPTLCPGESVPDLATLVNGNHLLWYPSETGGTGSSTPPSSDGTVPGTFTYWVSQSSSTCESPRVAVSYTIVPLPGTPSVTPLPNICVGMASPDLGSFVNGSDLTWYSSADAPAGSSTPPVISTDNSGTFEYWVSQTVNACEGPRTPITLTVQPISSPPTVTLSPPICPNSTPPDLNSLVSGTNLVWYNDELDDVGMATVPTIDASIPQTNTFWVSQNENTCESPRVPVELIVNPIPAEPAIADLPNICVGAPSLDLEQFVSGNNLLWYLSETGGTGSPTPPNSDGAVPGTFTYWVSQSSSTCESPRVAVSYTIVPLPGTPTVTPLPNVCVGMASPDLGSFVSGSNLTWYSSADATTGSGTPPVINTDNSGIFEYWVSQTINDCEGPRASITLSVLPVSSPPTVTLSPPICANTTPPDLNSLVSGTNLVWYTNELDSVGMATAPTIDASIPQTNTYWVSQNENTCESPRVPVELIVKPIPNGPAIANLPNLCVGDSSLDLQLLVSGQNLRWYIHPNQDTAIAAPVIETAQGQRYDFWVSQTLTACESPRLPVSITVTDLVISTSGPQVIEEGDELELSVDIDIYPDDEGFFTIWSDGTGRIIETGNTDVLVYPEDNTIYNVQVDAGACSANGEIPVEVIFQIDPTAIFSPNGDGRNDTWYIGDIGRYPKATLTVYNRWGATVYQAQDYQNDWDGRGRNGAELPLATYYYVVDLNQFGLKPVTGHVTIIR